MEINQILSTLFFSIIINIVLMLCLLFLASRNGMCIRIIGEIFFGVGIAFITGTVFVYDIIIQPQKFLTFLIIGSFLLLMGSLMKMISEKF